MGGGGDYSPLSFIYRLPREEDYVALWPLPTHAGAKKIIISIHHHQEFFNIV